MKKSLFARIFYMCTGITLASTLLVGATLLVVSIEYFKGDIYASLERNNNNAIDATIDNYRGNDYLFLDAEDLTEVYKSLSVAIGADIFFVDHSGNTLLCDDYGNCEIHKNTVPLNIMAELYLEDEYEGSSTLGEIYDEDHYVYAQGVVSQNKTIGYMFVTQPDAGSAALFEDIVLTFIFGTLILLLCSFVVVYLLTEKLVSPLRQMSNAATSFAKGDFSLRIPLNGVDEVDKLAMAFNNMATSLSELELTRRSFVANVSHELKTPMTSIGGFIDGILDGTIPQSSSKHYLELVSSEVKRLHRLVVSMLGMARMEAGETKFVPQAVDAHSTVCSTIFTFEHQIESKNIDVRGLDVEKKMVLADPDLLHQIFYNLFENAVKFTPENGTIDVEYTVKNKMINISIKNSGEGIEKEDIPRLFDRFYKTDKSRGIDKNGVGLGLYIVKTLVHMQGGEVFLNSTYGEYTEFVISMPEYDPKSPSAKLVKPQEIK